jgi:ribonuclease BN (tRNA processing enzyme)
VDGLLAAAGPALRAGWGFPGQSWDANVAAVEFGHGDSITLDALEVTVAENTHFTVPEGSTSPRSAVSLSYRFDAADRSIVYSGDTGPSDELVDLARGADLLVSEMIDDELALARMRPAGVARLVITHFAPAPAGPEQAQAYLDAIAEQFDGDAELAVDLGRY